MDLCFVMDFELGLPGVDSDVGQLLLLLKGPHAITHLRSDLKRALDGDVLQKSHPYVWVQKIRFEFLLAAFRM